MNLKSSIATIAGLMVAYVGWAMWQQSKLDIEVLYPLLLKEIDRLVREPLAILGFIIMFFGIAIMIRSNITSEARYQE